MSGGYGLDALGELVFVFRALRAAVGGADFLFRVIPAFPVGALDTLTGLEVLVDLEEVLDLESVELRNVGELLPADLALVTNGDRDDLVVAARLVTHAEHSQCAAANQAAGERRLFEKDEDVERVAVFAERPFDESVVIGVSGCCKEHAIEPDATIVMVDLVFIAIPLRDLDRDVEFHVRDSIA